MFDVCKMYEMYHGNVGHPSLAELMIGRHGF